MLLITWWDIVEDPDWQDTGKAEITGTATCQTLGFYLNKDKDCVRLSSTISQDQRNVIVIPLGCVINVIKVGKIK